MTRRQEKGKAHADGGVSSWPGMSCSAVSVVSGMRGTRELGQDIRDAVVKCECKCKCRFTRLAWATLDLARMRLRSATGGTFQGLAASLTALDALEPWNVLTDCTLTRVAPATWNTQLAFVSQGTCTYF